MANVAAKMLPIWQWEDSGTCSLDAVLLIALLFVTSFPRYKSIIPQSAIQEYSLQISPFSFFAKNLRAIFTQYGTWDNVPPAELTLLRNQVRVQLERIGIATSHESDITNCLDQLMPSCYRKFSLSQINRCSQCGNGEHIQKSFDRDTLYIHVLRFMAGSDCVQLRLESMIDYRMKVSNMHPKRYVSTLLTALRRCLGVSSKSCHEAAVVPHADRRCSHTKLWYALQQF